MSHRAPTCPLRHRRLHKRQAPKARTAQENGGAVSVAWARQLQKAWSEIGRASDLYRRRVATTYPAAAPKFAPTAIVRKTTRMKQARGSGWSRHAPAPRATRLRPPFATKTQTCVPARYPPRASGSARLRRAMLDGVQTHRRWNLRQHPRQDLSGESSRCGDRAGAYVRTGHGHGCSSHSTNCSAAGSRIDAGGGRREGAG